MHKSTFGLFKSWITLLLLLFFFTQGDAAWALVKDSDLDGLSDQSETEIYHTDPAKIDSDSDTISDGQEVLDGTNPLDSLSSKIADFEAEKEVILAKTNSLPWIIGRASGIFAFLLLSMVVVNGLLISTRLVFRVLPPPLNYDMHHFLSWAALLAVVGHALSFVFDPFFRLTIGEALLPFTLQRSFTSALGMELRWAIGLGILAFYGLVALWISSYFKTKIPLKWWRVIHYVSFVTYLLFLGHGIVSGTDTKNWWMITLYGVSALLVGGLTIIRIVTAIRQKKARSVSPANENPDGSSPTVATPPAP